MPNFNSHGIIVNFPFNPYDQQREFCSSVVEAIKKGQDAILESPTGTGKTMSLLASSLAWLQSTTEKSTIYYLSRTHIQLSQAAKEMKKTIYSKVPAVVLASRSHMCLNDEVKTHGMNVSINRACQNAIAKNSCAYFTNYEEKLKARLDINKVHDIEDLHAFGRANHCCPYYASKKLAETQAAIVFMPYNYILDLHVRKSTQLKLNKSILIIDEGHNIEGSLKDSASGMFAMTSLKIIQECCEKLPHKLSEALMRDLHGLSRQGYDPDSTKRPANILSEQSTKQGKNKKKEDKPSTIEELSEKLTTQKLQQVSRSARLLENFSDILKTVKGRYVETKCEIDLVLNRLKDVGIDFGTADSITTTLECMATFWSIVGVVNPHVVARYMAALTDLCHFISIIFPPGTMSKLKFDQHIASLKKHYSAYMLFETERNDVLQDSNKLSNWQMHIWCLDPGIGLSRVIDDFSKPRSIIITSGTLAPLDAVGRDLDREFKIVKDFEHVIKENQMAIKILSHGPNGYSLRSTYENTENPKYLDAIGQTISTLCSILPYGTLIFFPSYRLLRLVLHYCERKPHWEKMARTTNVFRESKNQASFSDDILSFKKIVDAEGRAVFLGVCRGKLSEGTNLQRNHCRSVIIVGLPYQSHGDPRIKETLLFHERKGDKNGQFWYTNQMKRALCQAIGRVIRSKDDFGMVFLCDPRFTMYKLAISKWIQKFYPNCASDNYDELVQAIKEFFSGHDINITTTVLTKAASQSGGAFEIERPTRRLNIGSSRSQPADPSLLNDIKSKSIDDVIEAEPKSYRQREAAVLAAYTVSSDTYEKIQSRLKSKQKEEPVVKKARTNKEVIESIFSDVSTSECPAPKPIVITRSNQCYVCLNEARQPHTTNCKCARTGCFTCLKGLNNKSCGECQVELKMKLFKPKLFNMFKKN